MGNRIRLGVLVLGYSLLVACGGGSGGGETAPMGLTAITPGSGPSGGGTSVVVAGSGFAPDVAVRFGGAPATGIVVESATRLTCRTPAGVPGITVDVVVQGPDGGAVLPDGFAYHPAPQVLAVRPDAVFATGGPEIVLTGSGFQANEAGANVVLLGGTTVPGAEVVDDTTLRFACPPLESSGRLDVTVRNANGEAVLAEGLRALAYPPEFADPATRLGVTDPEAWSREPLISGGDGGVYAVWADWRDGSGSVPYLNASFDGGATWQPSDRRVAASPSTLNAWRQCVASDDDRVCVAWVDQRNGGFPHEDLYFNRSLDGGSSWLPEDLLLSDGVVPVDRPDLCCTGDHVYAVWSGDGDLSAEPGIYFSRSTDGGATWLATPLRLDADDPGVVCRGPHVACDGPTVYVTWHHDGPTGDLVLFTRSTDAGASWLAAPRALCPPDPGCAWPVLGRVGVCIYVAWYGSGPSGVYFNRSEDGGDTWLAAPLVVSGAFDGLPRLAASQDNVYVVWKHFDASAPGYFVYATSSADRGATWGPPVPLGSQPIPPESGTVEVSCDGDLVAVVWGDEVAGRKDVLLNCSGDAGTTWLPAPLEMGGNIAFGQVTWPPRIGCLCVGPRVHVIWEEQANEIRVRTNGP